MVRTHSQQALERVRAEEEEMDAELRRTHARIAELERRQAAARMDGGGGLLSRMASAAPDLLDDVRTPSCACRHRNHAEGQPALFFFDHISPIAVFCTLLRRFLRCFLHLDARNRKKWHQKTGGRFQVRNKSGRRCSLKG